MFNNGLHGNTIWGGRILLIQSFGIDPFLGVSQEEMKPSGKKSSRIFVARIPTSITEESFRRHFSQFGVITDAYMPKEPSTGTHRGIGFITYDDPAAVDTVVAETHELGATQLAVDRALSKDEGGGGGYRERDYRPLGRGYGAGRYRGMEDGYGTAAFDPPADPYEAMAMDAYRGGWGGAVMPPMGRGDGQMVGPVVPPRNMTSMFGPGMGLQAGGWGRGRGIGTTKVFVGRLPPFVSLEELRSYFGKYGRVVDVYLPKDPKKTGTRGFGFVTFSDEGAAERVASRSHELNGHPIAVDLATQKEDGGGFSVMNVGAGAGAGAGAGVPLHMAPPISPGHQQQQPLSPPHPMQAPPPLDAPYNGGGVGGPAWGASPTMPAEFAGVPGGVREYAGVPGGIGPYRTVARGERMYRPY
eukprot:TRINITY_DN349_c1_g1_i2.p1 TRINITY_DN349_c1_g1~~TRINITY_DN349_c1_g1_i2.p1  ORF type:complete len:413 (-),score=78.98 TRINITY_DN349_c1_g1_i2:603-1841(-)